MHIKRKKSTTLKARETVLQLLRKLGLQKMITEIEIAEAWPKIVGQNIAESTKIERFYQGVLTIKTAHAAWQNELTFLKENILHQLNALFPTPIIKEIRILAGHIKKPQQPLPKQKPNSEDTLLAEKLCQTIQDPELKEIFLKTIAKGSASSRNLT